MFYNLKDLEEMNITDITKVDKNSLVNIDTVQIDTALPIEERMLNYLEQIKNPYCFLVGNVPVKVIFKDKGRTLDNAVRNLLTDLKST